jgi:glycerol-3-phosphate acyltransferase PlsY
MNTTQIVFTVVIAVASYFIGGLSPALLLSKLTSGRDIRQVGSGNAGAANVFRNLGVRLGILTFVLDIAKGVIPTLIARLCIDQFATYYPGACYAAYLAGGMVVLGHTFPVFLGFKGGKGVSTTVGMLFVIQPVLTAVLLLFAFSLIFATGIVSLGSIVCAVLIPVAGFLIPALGFHVSDMGLPFVIFGLCIALLIVWNHRENIDRLLKGTETRIDPKKLKR